MHLHDLNPHVLNSLLCLIGILICLVLLVCSAVRPRRRQATRPGPRPLKIGRPHRPSQALRPLMYGPHIILREKEDQSFRQVA